MTNPALQMDKTLVEAHQKSLITHRRTLVVALAAAAMLATSCGSADRALSAQTTVTETQPSSVIEEDVELSPAEADPDAPPADYDSLMAAENDLLGLDEGAEVLNEDEQVALTESAAPGTALFVEVENLRWETQASCLRKAGFEVEALPANADGVTTYRQTSAEPWDEVAAALGTCGFDPEQFRNASQEEAAG